MVESVVQYFFIIFIFIKTFRAVRHLDVELSVAPEPLHTNIAAHGFQLRFSAQQIRRDLWGNRKLFPAVCDGGQTGDSTVKPGADRAVHGMIVRIHAAVLL